MKLRHLLLASIVSLFITLLVSCNFPARLPFQKPDPAPTPTASVTPTPTPIPTPTPTPTPVPAARIHLGDTALLYGDWEKALLEFETARQSSTDPEVEAAALLGIARTHLLDGNIQEAITTLENYIPTAPQTESSLIAHAYFFLAQAYTVAERYAEAAGAYTNYLALRPGVIDAYILDLRGDAFMEAANYPAAAADFQAALTQSSLLDSNFLEMKTARAYALGGNYEAALGLYDDLYNRTSNDFTRALIHLRKGQIYTNLGQLDQAQQSFIDAVTKYPTSYDSYSALQALVDSGIPVDDLNSGLVYYYAGDYGKALASFDSYLQNSPADPGTGYFFIGLINREIGEHESSLKAWDQIIQNFPDHYYLDDAWEQKAYTQWYYLDEYSQAIQTLLDFVAENPDHPRAGEFLFDAAQIAERDGQLEQASELWERMHNLYPNDENANRALFLAGLSRYRAGKFQEAQDTFQRLLDLNPPIEDRTASLFWIGKALRAQGNEEEARLTWEKAQNIDPTGYYSERAREVLRNRPPFTSPIAYDLAFDQESERQKADEWMRTTFGLAPDTDLSGLGELTSDPNIIRGTELWHLGLFDDARSEFELARQSTESDAVQSYRLANYLLELGLYRSAITAARQVLDIAGLSDAETLNAPAYFNHFRFGPYYSEILLPVAEKYDIHPLLLFSLIRQESLFESFVRSSAAASGLMQVIPSTGEQVASNLGWPPDFSSQDLSRPLVSVTLGTDYLKTQIDNFEGDIYAALAAYNGGPGNALQWKKLAPGDPDLFLEVIRYAETRNYIRGIYEIYNIYRRIYDRTP